MNIRLKYCQNKWSEFGKDFSVKLRKNTVFLIVFNALKIRKNTQEFLRFRSCNLLKPNKIQNERKINMDRMYSKLGNARSIR